MSDIGSDGVLAGVKELSPAKKLFMHFSKGYDQSFSCAKIQVPNYFLCKRGNTI